MGVEFYISHDDVDEFCVKELDREREEGETRWVQII